MSGYIKRAKPHVEESAFVSMTDMTISFLFVMLILLAFFATQIQNEDVVPKKEYDDVVVERDKLKKEVEKLKKKLAKTDELSIYLNAIAKEKQLIMEKIRDKIYERFPGIHLEIERANGVIRLRGDDLFKPGRWRVLEGSRTEGIAKAIADALNEILPCFSIGSRSRFREECNSSDALFSTIQIEGHTDDEGISQTLKNREQMIDNFDLSARRGAETFRAMVERHIPELTEYKNQDDQPILSFSGYGSMRPLVQGSDPEARQANRRIDIRFIMGSPSNLQGMESIREALRTTGVIPE